MEKILEDLKNTAKTAMKKSGEILELGKLKIAAVDTQNEINKAFCELGRALYNAEKSGSEDAEELKQMIDNIDNLYEKLSVQEEQYRELKNEKKCSSCGAKCSDKSNFCSVCGEKFE